MRILVFSGNRLFGQCLCRGLSEQPDVEHAHACDSASDIPAMALSNDASAVLIDLGDPEGEQAARTIAAAIPDTPILALSVDDSVAAEIMDCARLGCRSFVPRKASISDVVRIIHAAERGEVTMRPSVAACLMQAIAEKDVADPNGLPECLTRREKEICSLICEGLTNKEIAREIGRSVGTIKNHVSSILSKLDVPRRSAIHNCLGHDGAR